ncbi:MAG: uracil-DNA glycosylase [Bacteroidota bacterium]
MQNTIAELIEALKDQRSVFGELMLDRGVLPEVSSDTLPVSSSSAGVHARGVADISTGVYASAASAAAGGNQTHLPAGFAGPNDYNIEVPVMEQLSTDQSSEFAGHKAADLDELRQIMLDCHLCPLEKTRNSLVFGKGNPKAKVMIIGEAPGADEDRQGEPFVGRAGKLLTDILKAINFTREEVYITNILKCRPPGNRNPLPGEMQVCMPYLRKQIELIQPRLILCLGLIAAGGVLNLKQTLTKMRGNIYQLGNISVMVTYHPAALLRNPEWKRGAWEDVQKFRKLYDDMMAG